MNQPNDKARQPWDEKMSSGQETGDIFWPKGETSEGRSRNYIETGNPEKSIKLFQELLRNNESNLAKFNEAKAKMEYNWRAIYSFLEKNIDFAKIPILNCIYCDENIGEPETNSDYKHLSMETFQACYVISDEPLPDGTMGYMKDENEWVNEENSFKKYFIILKDGSQQKIPVTQNYNIISKFNELDFNEEDGNSEYLKEPTYTHEPIAKGYIYLFHYFIKNPEKLQKYLKKYGNINK